MATALAAVAPFLTALPAGTPVNVNTAPPEVLMAIVDKLSGDGLAKLVAARARAPFNKLSEFRAELPPTAAFSDDETLSVKSDYFYVTIEAQQGDDARPSPSTPASPRQRVARRRLADRRIGPRPVE